MSSGRDVAVVVLATAGVVALGLGAFAGGWMLGARSGETARLEARIAALEQSARRDVAAAPVAQPQPTAPAAPQAPAPPDPAQVQAAIPLEGSPAKGPDTAPVSVVAFSDFQCPYCARVNPTLDQIREEYPEQVRVVFKHFPLPMHPQAMNAHKAAVAAAAQGKFWEMHDRVFAAPQAMDPASLREHAEAIGLDLARYDAAVASPETEARVRADMQQGSRVGVRGTPTFFVNGVQISGAQPFERFQVLIEQALAEPPRLAGEARGGEGS